MIDATSGLLQTKSQQILLSVRSLRNICLVVSICIFATAVGEFVLLGKSLAVGVTVGRLVNAAGALLAALLAHRGFTRSAFALFSFIQIVAICNAVFVAGFGAYSPALMFSLPVVVLSVALFGYPRGLLWAAPSIALWFVVAINQLINWRMTVADEVTSSAQSALYFGASAIPSPVALLLSQLIVGLVVVIVVRLYERQSALLLSDEQRKVESTRDEMEMKGRLSDEREKFMSHLAHELRTPLAAMRNAMTLANHPKANDSVRQKSLGTLDRSISNLQDLLNDALDSFKYGRPDFALKDAEFSVREFLGGVETMYGGLAQARGLQFAIETDAPDTQLLMGDKMRLGQMVSNLISNAIKFTQSGAVTVRLMESTYESGFWRFEVKDTGPGISAQDQQSIFKPFVQFGDEFQQTSAGIKGTGLGLSIVAQLAHAMGGFVGLQSEPGVGSVFFFEVPLRASISAPAILRSV